MLIGGGITILLLKNEQCFLTLECQVILEAVIIVELKHYPRMLSIALKSC